MSELQVPIRIKRGVGGPPATLLRGELAYNETSNELYIGKGASGSTDASGRPIAATVEELLAPAQLLSALADVVLASGPNDGDVLTYDATAGKWIAQAVAAAPVAWADITGKPSVFTPDTHTHAWGDITSGVPSTFAPSTHASSHATGGADAIAPADIGAAAASHTHVANDITNLADVAKTGEYSSLLSIPSTFTPSAHNHTIKQELSGFIESPEAKTYVLSPATHAAMTITQLKAQTSAGTVDVKIQDDGADVTGATLADAGTTLASLASDISVSVAAGSKLTLVVSDPQSSPADLAFTVHYTIASENN